MTEYTLGIDPSGPVLEIVERVTAAVRAPSGVRTDRDVVLVFDPDLSTAELAALEAMSTDLVGGVRARDLSLTIDEYRALRPSLDALRAFQQMSRADFMALTAAERERRTFDTLTALIRVDRAVLRD